MLYSNISQSLCDTSNLYKATTQIGTTCLLIKKCSRKTEIVLHYNENTRQDLGNVLCVVFFSHHTTLIPMEAAIKVIYVNKLINQDTNLQIY